MDADEPRLDYPLRNRVHWDNEATWWADAQRGSWSAKPAWGLWRVPDQTGLYDRASGSDTLEVGCGTGYISAWLARAGARAVGLDNSWRQLQTAAAWRKEYDLSLSLVHGIGERLPFADGSFDFVVSEYGSAIWSDPYLWIPEAGRVLRAGGELIFLGNAVLFTLTVPDLDGHPAEETLRRPQFGMHRFEWPDSDSVEFHLSHGDMVRLLRREGFEILDLIEIQAPEGPAEVRFNVTRDWARRWPTEEIWHARKLP